MHSTRPEIVHELWEQRVPPEQRGLLAELEQDFRRLAGHDVNLKTHRQRIEQLFCAIDRLETALATPCQRTGLQKAEKVDQLIALQHESLATDDIDSISSRGEELMRSLKVTGHQTRSIGTLRRYIERNLREEYQPINEQISLVLGGILETGLTHQHILGRLEESQSEWAEVVAASERLGASSPVATTTPISTTPTKLLEDALIDAIPGNLDQLLQFIRRGTFAVDGFQQELIAVHRFTDELNEIVNQSSDALQMVYEKQVDTTERTFLPNLFLARQVAGEYNVPLEVALPAVRKFVGRLEIPEVRDTPPTSDLEAIRPRDPVTIAGARLGRAEEQLKSAGLRHEDIGRMITSNPEILSSRVSRMLITKFCNAYPEYTHIPQVQLALARQSATYRVLQVWAEVATSLERAHSGLSGENLQLDDNSKRTFCMAVCGNILVRWPALFLNMELPEGTVLQHHGQRTKLSSDLQVGVSGLGFQRVRAEMGVLLTDPPLNLREGVSVRDVVTQVMHRVEHPRFKFLPDSAAEALPRLIERKASSIRNKVTSTPNDAFPETREELVTFLAERFPNIIIPPAVREEVLGELSGIQDHRVQSLILRKLEEINDNPVGTRYKGGYGAGIIAAEIGGTQGEMRLYFKRIDENRLALLGWAQRERLRQSFVDTVVKRAEGI